jgi:asparagine N-glycosylation enzyme membrane subunit Stt3
LVRKTHSHAQLQVMRPVGWALLACVPMAVLLLLWPLSLPLSILTGSILFAATAAAILRRGTEAGGLA